MRGEGGRGGLPLDPSGGEGVSVTSSHASPRGPVVVGVSSRGIMVKPGSVYHLHVPVTPLHGEIDLLPLRRISSSSNILGTILGIGGLALLILSLFFQVNVSLGVLAGFIIGTGVVTALHGLVICGAPGTLASLLLGTLSLGFGTALVLGDFDHSSVVLILALWLTTKGLATMMVSVGSAVISTWWAVGVSAGVSLCLAGVLFWYRTSASLSLLSALAGTDLLFSGLGFTLLACMAYAGMRMSEYESAGGDMAGAPYQPLSS